ncbi:hypothetical protein [Spirillospora sp. CA-294931]|uniref:hypothetical protein n=1 Tax=Spirillospora sp. CA-294931 TaxID=3240042 RepID=UPI003D8DD040
MKIRVEFTVEVDPDELWQVEPEQRREWLATEIAADISEIPSITEVEARIRWHRLGSTQIPYVIEYAAEKGHSIRLQKELDSLSEFS